MGIKKFYKVIAIVIAISLLVSFPIYYFYLAPQLSQNNNEQPNNVYRVQGILSVYKNDKLVHQGPDLLTNYFYNYLPFLLGNVCINALAYGGCTSGQWANGIFTSAPPTISCALYSPLSSTTIIRVPTAYNPSPSIYIGVGTGSSTSPTDCVVNSFVAWQAAKIRVWSPFTNNASGAPSPCPSPTAGCVQINATYSATSATTISEAMLYAWYNVDNQANLNYVYTLIAHDTFTGISMNSGDTLKIIYTFIFPSIPTTSGAFSENQGAIAAIFAQCLSRLYFGVGSTTSRLCIDNVLPTAGNVAIFLPANPCSDTQKPTQYVSSTAGTISISTNSTAKYVRITGQASASGSGIQIVMYNITASNPVKILEGSLSCSVGTSKSFTSGQSVGLQLNFP